MTINRDLAKAVAAAIQTGNLTTAGELAYDSSDTLSLIDSAYVAARVDAGTDSASVIALIDSDYVRLRETPAAAASPGVTAHTYDSSGGLLLASTVSHADGSLHWLGAVNELYVWDSGVGKYYLVEALKSIALGDVPPHQNQGETYGFASGGNTPAVTGTNAITRFTFANVANTKTDHGDLTVGRRGGGSSSSSTHGYHYSGLYPPYPNSSNVIDKFAMASAANATDVGDLNVKGHHNLGAASTTHGYNHTSFVTQPSGAYNDAVDRHSYSSDGNATDVGDLSGAGTSNAHYDNYANSTHHYLLYAGSYGSPAVDVAYKYDFASSISTTNLHGLKGFVDDAQGINSSSAGSVIRYDSYAPNRTVKKIPFATDTASVDTTDTGTNQSHVSGQKTATANGVTDGYLLGIRSNGSGNVEIDSYTYASSTLSTDIGEVNPHQEGSGHQQ